MSAPRAPIRSSIDLINLRHGAIADRQVSHFIRPCLMVYKDTLQPTAIPMPFVLEHILLILGLLYTASCCLRIFRDWILARRGLDHGTSQPARPTERTSNEKDNDWLQPLYELEKLQSSPKSNDERGHRFYHAQDSDKNSASEDDGQSLIFTPFRSREHG
ncbi:hypothetical protein FPV67DRAFT_1101667 [Lyophyllum atratum]|nr:hypothetical protein FPV67DRAFT_1101667 [Lyophyllum atratum]